MNSKNGKKQPTLSHLEEMLFPKTPHVLILQKSAGFSGLQDNSSFKKKHRSGDGVLSVDLDQFRLEVLRTLIYQAVPLQSDHLRLIRSHFKLSEEEFGQIFGVSATAVQRWENGHPPTSAMDLFIRMYIKEQLRLKNLDFGEQYPIKIANLARSNRKRKKIRPLIHLLEDSLCSPNWDAYET